MNAELMDEETIFRAVCQKQDPVDRKVYLDEVCGDNQSLRDAVAALLQAHQESGILDAPPVMNHVDGVPETDMEQPGSIIGRYKLLELIGEGGFGNVYMAEQQEPVRRTVALKIIKLGMDTKAVMARFEAERQALALMEHPNIAKVLDAGATDAGRPYFVMDLVRGVPITEYCDAKNLTTRERLRLFIDVCHAVQHAHQKGIIHRDIKPTNILVTQQDGKPVPKIIDFGVAKATQQRLTEKTVFTEHRQLVGTPEYMSPEQATFCEADVDTRSDIYSLGVVLYELLVGTTPFDAAALRSHGYDEICRVIRESDPPTPSKRLSTLGDPAVTDISKHRHVEPAAFRKLLRGDLDWIVMKALEKDRTRRYETAHGLARDIQRHLHDDPVRARPPSAGYRLKKFVRKHRGPVAAAVAVAVSITLGLVGTTVGFVRASGERDRAEKKHAEALQQRDRAIAMTKLVQRHTEDVVWEAIDYKLHVAEGGHEELVFRSTPLLLWDCGSVMNANDGQVGSAFIWLHGNRPAVVGAIRHHEYGDLVSWHHMNSLSPAPLIGDYRGIQVWTPAAAGVEFKPVPSAPMAATSAEIRGSQLRELARQFAAKYESMTAWSALELKPEPLYRYASPETDLVDGALFAFLDFTDPQVVLLIEARGQGSAMRWYYALARLSWRALEVRHLGNLVWEDPAPEPLGWANILKSGAYRTRSFIDYAPAAIPKIQGGESLRELAAAYEEYGFSLWQLGETNEAERAATEAQRIWKKLESQYGHAASPRIHRALMASNHSRRHRRAGGIRKAEVVAAEAVRLWKQLALDFPDDARFQTFLGTTYLDLDEWSLAAIAYAEAARLDPDCATSCRSDSIAALGQAKAGDLAAFRTTCARLLHRYNETGDSEVATRVVRASLWAPRAITDPDRIVELAELASPVHGRVEHELDLSIALYRAGRYREAADGLERLCTESGGVGRQVRCELARLTLSMAAHKLGDTRRAQTELDKAVNWISEPLLNVAGKPVPRIERLEWYHRLKLTLLREEAEQLLSQQSTTSGDN